MLENKKPIEYTFIPKVIIGNKVALVEKMSPYQDDRIQHSDVTNIEMTMTIMMLQRRNLLHNEMSPLPKEKLINGLTPCPIPTIIMVNT